MSESMSETQIETRMSDQVGDSTYQIDHNSDVGGVMHAERDDTNANPEGIWREEQVNTGVPPWVHDEFNVRENVNKDTGEIRYFVNPKPAVVNTVAAEAPKRVAAGIEKMTDEDYKLAQQLTADLDNYIQTAGAVDEFFANAPLYHLKSELTNAAVRATRWVKTITGGLLRLKEGQETPEWITNMVNMVESTNRRCAIISHMLADLEPDFRSKLRYDAAAWTVMQQEARKHQQQYFSTTSDKDNKTNEAQASLSLVANL